MSPLYLRFPEPWLSHVGKRVWDYSGVPRLPNTTARLEDTDSDDDSEEDSDDEDSSLGSTEASTVDGYQKPERKNVETAHTCFVTFTNMFDGWNVAHIYHERSALSGLIGADVESDQRIG